MPTSLIPGNWMNCWSANSPNPPQPITPIWMRLSSIDPNFVNEVTSGAEQPWLRRVCPGLNTHDTRWAGSALKQSHDRPGAVADGDARNAVSGQAATDPGGNLDTDAPKPRRLEPRPAVGDTVLKDCPDGLPDHLAAVSPFVIVPAQHLDQIAVDDLGHAEIDDRGAGLG
jgi:hypothetical protein